MGSRRSQSGTDIEATVNQLVEAEHARRDAREELDCFREYNTPPTPPEEFPNLRPLVEYYRSRRQREWEVEKRERTLSRHEQLYEQAAETLGDVLPEDVPLHHEQSGFHHVIVNRQGQIVIAEMTPLAGPPPQSAAGGSSGGRD